MLNIALALSFATFSLITHLCVQIAWQYPGKMNAWLLIGFLAACAAYNVHIFFNWPTLISLYSQSTLSASGLTDTDTWPVFVGSWLIAESAPWGLWAFLHQVFRTKPLSVPLLFLPLIAVTSLNIYAANQHFNAYPYLDLSNAINLGLIMLAVHEVLHEFRADLSNRRRKFRNLVFIAVVIFVLVFFYTEINRPSWTDIHALLLSRIAAFIITFSLSLIYFRAEQETLDELFVQSDREPAPEKTLTEEAKKILAAMKKEEVFKISSLSLSRLSEHLEIPEYKLRDVIKTEMGYENYNRFINKFRIEYAAEQLRIEHSLAINEVMRNSGFKSHPPFHRAFRETFGCTPAEYRKQQHHAI